MERRKKHTNRIHMLLKGAVACLIVVALTGCGEEKQKSNYEQGVESLEMQNYSAALNFFNASIAQNKNMQLAYRGQGLSYLGLGQYSDAINSFETALGESNGLLKKVDYDINYYLAVAEYKSGNLEGALDIYNNIIALKQSSDAYYLKGKITLEMGDYNGATECFAKAIEMKKTDPDLYINIYEDLSEKGYDLEAKSYINDAIRNVQKPSTYQLGVFNYYLGDFTQARNYFEESTDTRKTAKGVIYLGKTYEALGDPGYAATVYEDYVSKDKNAADIYNELGLLKSAEKDYEGALAAFENGLAAENSSCRQSLMYNQIITYEFLSDYAKAAELMGVYLELYPGDETAVRENVFLSTR